MGSPILDYATPKPSPPSQLARWIARLGHAIGRCPTWVLTMILMALVGMAMVWLPSWSPWHRVKEWLLVTPLFLAGAVKRRAGLHVLVLVGASALLFVMYDVVARAAGAIRPPYPHLMVESLLIGGFICCELWLLGRLRSVRAAAMAGLTLAAAMVVVLAHSWITGTTFWRWSAPGLPGAAELISAVVRPLVGLAAVSLLLREGSRSVRVQRITVTAVSVVFILLIEVAMVPLARHATRGGGVFDRISAGQCLWFRGRPEDSRHLVAALASADWSIPVNAAEHLDQDWRFQYIRLLWAWRPQRATDGLLHALLANPSDQFADWTAAKMAQERRYECAPIFMRYALWDDCEVCQEALHVMDEFFSAQRLVAHEAADGHKSIYPQSRPALAEILGKDAGDSIADWVSLIAIKVNEQSGPAPTVVRTETARLVELYLRWSSVATRIPANHPMRRLKLDVRTTDDLELEIEKWITQVTPLLGSTGGMAK